MNEYAFCGEVTRDAIPLIKSNQMLSLIRTIFYVDAFAIIWGHYVAPNNILTKLVNYNE